MKFRDSLRVHRIKAGLSQEVLADKMSVSRQTISKWENGDPYPSTKHILMLTDVLCCNLENLIDTETSQTETVSHKHKSRNIAYLIIGTSAILAIALFTISIPCRFETYLNEYSRINSLKASTFDKLADNSIDEALAQDGFTNKQILGYGKTKEDGTFYIKCDVENSKTSKSCTAIIYLCEDNGSFSYRCQYLDDPNYLPDGDYYKVI